MLRKASQGSTRRLEMMARRDGMKDKERVTPYAFMRMAQAADQLVPQSVHPYFFLWHSSPNPNGEWDDEGGGRVA